MTKLGRQLDPLGTATYYLVSRWCRIRLRPGFGSGWERARSKVGTRFIVVFPYSLCLAGIELVPSLTKNTASGVTLGRTSLESTRSYLGSHLEGSQSGSHRGSHLTGACFLTKVMRWKICLSNVKRFSWVFDLFPADNDLTGIPDSFGLFLSGGASNDRTYKEEKSRWS